jgi:hypothetical protein
MNKLGKFFEILLGDVWTIFKQFLAILFTSACSFGVIVGIGYVVGHALNFVIRIDPTFMKNPNQGPGYITLTGMLLEFILFALVMAVYAIFCLVKRIWNVWKEVFINLSS